MFGQKFIVMAISNRLKSIRAWLSLLWLGCALSACAHDEDVAKDSSQHHGHHGGGGGRYGHGEGQGQGGTFDQPNPSGSPSPVPGE
jgi:hypothetical protein